MEAAHIARSERAKRLNDSLPELKDCEALGIKIPKIRKFGPGTAVDHGAEPEQPVKRLWRGKRGKT